MMTMTSHPRVIEINLWCEPYDFVVMQPTIKIEIWSRKAENGMVGMWHNENLSQGTNTLGIESNDVTKLINLWLVIFSSFNNKRMQESLLHDHLRKLHNYYWSKGCRNLGFQELNLKVGLRIMIVTIKVDSCAFYVRFRIWLFFCCLDCIIFSLFKMICSRIINRNKGQIFSLILKPLEFFSCQQSSPTTLDEGRSPSLSSIIIATSLILSFWSLLGID